MNAKPRIAHFAGPNATILNSPPLVTSNKARKKYGLPPAVDPDHPTAAESAAVREKVAAYQAIFDSH